MDLETFIIMATDYESIDQFFTAVLFATGPTPQNLFDTHEAYVYDSKGGNRQRVSHLDERYVNQYFEWRRRVVVFMTTHTHHSVNPSDSVSEYLTWLQKTAKQNS